MDVLVWHAVVDVLLPGIGKSRRSMDAINSRDPRVAGPSNRTRVSMQPMVFNQRIMIDVVSPTVQILEIVALFLCF